VKYFVVNDYALVPQRYPRTSYVEMTSVTHGK